MNLKKIRSFLVVATVATAAEAVLHPNLCQSQLSYNYQNAILNFPYLKQAIELVGQQPITRWYTDSVSDIPKAANDAFANCLNGERPIIAVYGLPNKDCAHGFSSGGKNKNSEDYRNFLNFLATASNNKPVVYILEPDAVGLLADYGCGNQYNYNQNLKIALEVLGANPNADIYLDVGYWTISDDLGATKMGQIVKGLDTIGRIKGIAINTSNYRSNKEMSDSCARFNRVVTEKNYRCIIDTSRNYFSPPNGEWCNAKTSGMGTLPTTQTNLTLIDYFVWVKPPGESDGECTGRTSDAMVGPAAGQFFSDHFVNLWNNGIFVKKMNFASLDVSKLKDKTPANIYVSGTQLLKGNVVMRDTAGNNDRVSNTPSMVPTSAQVTAVTKPPVTTTVKIPIGSVAAVNNKSPTIVPVLYTPVAAAAGVPHDAADRKSKAPADAPDAAATLVQNVIERIRTVAVEVDTKYNVVASDPKEASKASHAACS